MLHKYRFYILAFFFTLIVFGTLGFFVSELYLYEERPAPVAPVSAEIHEDGDTLVVEITEGSASTDNLVVEWYDNETEKVEIVFGFGSDRWENTQTAEVGSEESEMVTAGGWFESPSRLEIERPEADGRMLVQYVEEPPDGGRATVAFEDL